MEAGRATLPAALSAGYLAALLDGFDRPLTPREVVQSFYKNPSFPLVTSTDEIRRVLFELLTTGWELIDADGNPLSITGPGQISINSISQSLRRRAEQASQIPKPRTQPAGTTVPGLVGPGGDGGAAGLFGDDEYRADPDMPGPTPPQPSGPTVYKRYRIELSNRSITGADKRD